MNGLVTSDPIGGGELKNRPSISHVHGMSGLLKKEILFDDGSVFTKCDMRAVYSILVSADGPRRHGS